MNRGPAAAAENRAALIMAAREIFAEQGVDAPLSAIAKRAGVGQGSLYRHFPTREALAAAVYEGEMTALFDEARDPSRSAVDNLEAFLRGFVEYLVAHGGLARTLAAVVDPAVQAEGGSELERTVADLLARAAADGAVRADVAAGAVLIVLHGIGSAADRPHWASESRAAIELLINGLRTV